MIRVREPRFLTMITIVGLALFTIARSAPLMRFGLDEGEVDAGNARARLENLFENPAVGSMARRLFLDVDNKLSSDERARAVDDLLTRTPLSGRGWLELAQARSSAGREMERVASALALSSLVAPNEISVMAGRASFGLPLWRELPPQTQKSLITDLVGAWPEMEERERDALSLALSQANGETRESVRANLLLQGKEATPIIHALILDE